MLSRFMLFGGLVVIGLGVLSPAEAKGPKTCTNHQIQTIVSDYLIIACANRGGSVKCGDGNAYCCKNNVCVTAGNIGFLDRLDTRPKRPDSADDPFDTPPDRADPPRNPRPPRTGGNPDRAGPSGGGEPPGADMPKFDRVSPSGDGGPQIK